MQETTRVRGLLVVAGLAAVATAIFVLDPFGISERSPTPGDSVDTAMNRADVEPEAEARTGDLDATDRTEVASDANSDAAGTGAEEGARPVAEPDSAGFVLAGRVVDARGAGIEGARVVRRGVGADGPDIGRLLGVDELGEAATALTDPDGIFSLGGGGLGRFELVVEHEAHPRERHVGEATGERTEGIVITLRDGVSIDGIVSGVPDEVEDVLVFAREVKRSGGAALLDITPVLEGVGLPVGGRHVVADSERRFSLGGVDPELEYSVWAVRAPARDAGEPEIREFEIGEFLGHPASAAVEVRGGARGVELRWREALAVVLRVVDAETGAPVERMRVSAGFEREMKVFGMSVPFAAKSALPQRVFPAGEVTIGELAVPDGGPPRLAVAVVADGYRTWSETFDVPGDGTGPRDFGVIRLERAPVVRVRVVADADGTPVAGAIVRIVAPPSEDDSRSIGINASTSVSSRVETSESDFESSPGAEPEIDLDVGGDSTGDRSEATTDADGIAEITVDELEVAVIVVVHDDFARAASASFELPTRGTVERDVRLLLGGEALVRVVDAHGAVVAGAKVDRRGVVAGDEESITTGTDGHARFERLTPGVHEFKLVDEAVTGGLGGIRIDLGALERDDDRGTDVVIVDGLRTEVELVEPLRCTLRGTVSLDGEPLEGARVRVVPPGGDGGLGAEALEMVGSMLGGVLGELASVEDSSRSKTDDRGAFELKDVVVGPVRVVVSHRDLVMPISSPVELVEGENRHDVAFRSTSIRGRVRGSDGEPLRGARVTVGVATDDDRASQIVAGFDQAEELLSGMFGTSATRGVRTDDEGRFELRGVEAGERLLLRFDARRHVATSLVVEPLAEGSSRDDVSVRLVASGRVRVRASGVEHAIAAKAEWIGAPIDPKPGDVHALLKNGRTTLDGLAPGRWRISLETTDSSRRDVAHDVEVVAGETVQVEW